MNIEIANKLLQLRKEKGLSQEQLAQELGISRQAVSKWERAEASPDTDNLIQLAKLYDISLDELLLHEPSHKQKLNDDHSVKENEGYLEDLHKSHRFPLEALLTLCVLLYAIITNRWHPTWMIIFFIPVADSLVTCIRKKKISKFAYPIFCVWIYLFLGFYLSLWHPGWIIFLSIPCFYALANYIDHQRA